MPFSLRPRTLLHCALAACLSLLGLFGLADSASAQISTSTTLSVTTTDGSAATTIATGTVVVFTASVTQAGSNDKVTQGTIKICASGPLQCTGPRLFGEAQLTSKGTATLKFKPAVGAHGYYAQFLGTKTNLPSSTLVANLTVTGGPYATTTSIAQSGTAGNYTLTATVSSANSATFSPTGTIDFLDTSDSNYQLGSALLAVGQTTSSFAGFTTHYAGYSAHTVIVADFNQDGIPDLLTANNANNGASTNFISILFGQPGGTFQGATSYANNLGDLPSAIAVGDLNGDGYPDVVVAGLTTQQIYVYLNDGKGNLNGPTTYFFNYSGNLDNGPVWPVGGLAIGDVNGDGKQDVLLTFPQFAIPGSSCSETGEGGECSAIGVMFGNGDGSLQMSDPNTTSQPWVPSYSSGFVGGGVNELEPIVLADLRGNGKLDTVGTYYNVGQICVGLGNGDGTFENATCYASPSGPTFAVGDFNGDGKPDLVVASSGGNGVSVLLGNGDGTFQSAVVVGPEAFTEGVAAADVDGDGKLDIVAANGDGTINIMFGNGDGTFGALNSYHGAASGDRLDSVAVADLNGDGVMDLVATDQTNWSANVMFGSVSTSATATLAGVSPVGSSTTTHAVEASYGGDTYYLDSTSSTTSLGAQPVPTTLAISTNTPTVAAGGQVTLTAIVSPDAAQNYAATGLVTFSMNGASIGTASVSNGVAILKPSLAVVRTDLFTASYAGDSNFVASSTSVAAQVVVQKAATTLTLGVCNYSTNWTCPATTSSYGQVIQVAATLAPYSVTGGQSSDGETVTFYNNGAILGTESLLDGVATMTLSQPAAGSYSFTASYGGDATLIASSTSSPSSMNVAKAASTMSLGISPLSTTTYGQPVYLTATFQTYPYNVSGETVTFLNGTNVVGTATFGSDSSPATLTLNNLPVGSYNFTARYSGDSNYSSTSTTASALTVQKLTTALIVSAPSSTTFTYGSPISIQVFLEPYNVPGGNTTNGELVTLYQKNNQNAVTTLGTAAVTGGVATFTVNVPPVGSDAYSASYAGDASFASTSIAASGTSTVSVQQVTTSMGITSSAPHGIIGSGQPLTLTATILPYAEAGGASTNGEPVTFSSNGTYAGTGTLLNGTATFTYPSGLAKGNYSFTASYAQDTNFLGSYTTYAASVDVLQSTALTLSASPAHFGALNQVVTLTATLSPYTSTGGSTNGQEIQFFDNNDQWTSAPLSNGVATLVVTSGLTQGSHSFTALYQSDGVFAGSDTSANPIAFDVATIENYVVNFAGDDAGTAANCTPQSSTTINATDTACSLRDSLLAAASSPEGANVTFASASFPGPTTITLTNGTLTVPASTTLTGPTLYTGPSLTNLVTVNGNGVSMNQASSIVFSVTGAGTNISNLIITGGWINGNGGVSGNGAGITNSGTLTLTNSTVTNNGTIFAGGGIYNTGTLKVIGCTIANNFSGVNGPGNGGGIDNESNGTLTIINSTIANNYAQSGFGGGVAVDSGTATIVNSTLSGNSSGGRGSGIYNVVGSGGGTVTLGNTIVSGNNGLTDIEGSYTDNGGNIVGYFNENLVSDPNLLSLGPLDSYGGPTQTMLPLPGSSAICTGTIGNSPSQWQLPLVQIDIDQRGYENYNIHYSQLPFSNAPLPSVCFDSGAVETNYQSMQLLQTSYTGLAGGAIAPQVVAEVWENNANRGAVPVTLSYSGAGTLSGNTAITVGAAGATFSSLSVGSAGSGTLSTTMIVAGTSRISASASLSVLPAPQISPGSLSISAVAGAPLSQVFSVSGGSGIFQLTNSGSLSAGLTLTPPGVGTGASWTLSGTPLQDGTFTFTLTATDVANSIVTVSQSYTLTVAPSTTTTLTASPVATAAGGQTVTITAIVSSPTANGTVSFFDAGNLLGPGAVSLSGGSPNIATLALNASTLGSPLAFGPHSFTAQFSGDATDASSTSNTLAYNVTAVNFVVNTIGDDAGSFPCTTLASTTSNTTDGNSGGNPGLCTLRDALNSASGLGAGSIYFDTTVFAASNLAGNPAANTIAPNVVANGSLTIASNTTIQGLTSGSGATLTNLVTVDGGGAGVANNATIFAATGTGTAINNLNINNGYASNGGSGGAITNSGSIAISGSSFTGNQATSSGGGIFNIFGGTVTVANSTFALNSALGGNGGAIDNANYDGCGITTVTNSTFYQNTAVNSGAGFGGAINNDGNGPCTVTVNSSTIVGNSSDAAGGGIYNSILLYAANSIVSGNTNSTNSNADDIDDLYTQGGSFWNGSVINGNLIGVYNGAAQNGVSVSLAPLANHGGPTQTMLPLPGSSAICAGLPAAIAFGITTDERGLSNTNATYPGYSAGSPCVDAGAVQTAYAIAFTTEPPLSVPSGLVPINPAPVVSLTESSVPATFVVSPLAISDSASALIGTTAANFVSGAAAFSNLLFTGAPGADQLVATLSLNPSLAAPLSLTAQSTGFQVGTPAAAVLTSPTNGSSLTSTSATFTWTSVDSATGYFLLIGTQGVGSHDLYNSAEKSVATTSYTFTHIPLTGVTLYVRLYTNFNGNWIPSDSQYIAAGPAVITAPAAGSTLPGASATFTWSASNAATGYFVLIGTQGAGSNNLYNSVEKPASTTSFTFAHLPLTGIPIYVRLVTNINGTWIPNDYQYTAAGPAAITAPAAGTTLPGSSATFTWSANNAATGYFVLIGTQGVGSSDLYNSAEKPASTTSYTFPRMPLTGIPIYVRLVTNINGTWIPNDYQYTAAAAVALTAPANLSTLPGSSATFTWSASTAATGYFVLIGTQGVGSSDLYNSAEKPASITSFTFSRLPVTGIPIYVRLVTNINGTWLHNDYQFTAATGAILTAPATNSTFSGRSATFSWTAAANTNGYFLWIGSTAGGNDIYNSAEKTVTTYTFTGLPTNGEPIYVRLWSDYGGVWTYNDYRFTAAN